MGDIDAELVDPLEGVFEPRYHLVECVRELAQLVLSGTDVDILIKVAGRYLDRRLSDLVHRFQRLLGHVVADPDCGADGSEGADDQDDEKPLHRLIEVFEGSPHLDDCSSTLFFSIMGSVTIAEPRAGLLYGLVHHLARRRPVPMWQSWSEVVCLDVAALCPDSCRTCP